MFFAVIGALVVSGRLSPLGEEVDQ